MKTLITAAAVLVATTNIALAEGGSLLPAMPEVAWPDMEVTVGAERELEAEVNSLYGSVSMGAITLGTTMKDTATDNGSFNITKYEVDVVQPLGAHVSLYFKNDFTDDLKHSETVVGGKVKF